jgi:hypothetical protein
MQSPPCGTYEGIETKRVRSQDKDLPGKKKKRNQKHTTAGIRWWSPTQLLICRSEAYVWQSGRDAQCSSVYGRM